MKSLLVIGLIFSISISITAQKINPLEDIKFYADVVANAGNPAHKERAQKAFAPLLDEWIKSDEFNLADLSSVQWLSVKQPADSSFTVITWQLQVNDNDNRYYGYLIKDDKVFDLQSTNLLDDLEYDVLSDKEWAGALYYNIHTVKTKEDKTLYILFGYNAFKNYEHRKIAEVLTFDSGQPVFGSEIFKKQEPGERGIIKNRLVLDYSNDANVNLNYNPGLDMIVFDHLIPRFGRIPGQGPTMLPDGSYVGYKWDGEFFNYIEKIYHQTEEEAPRPKPVLGEGRNAPGIFGRKKKN